MQKQIAVTAYFASKQLVLFAFAQLYKAKVNNTSCYCLLRGLLSSLQRWHFPTLYSNIILQRSITVFRSNSDTFFTLKNITLQKEQLLLFVFARHCRHYESFISATGVKTNIDVGGGGGGGLVDCPHTC